MQRPKEVLYNEKVGDWKDEFGYNFGLVLKIFFALLLLRGVFLFVGYRGYIPILDDTYGIILDLFRWLSGAAAGYGPRI